MAARHEPHFGTVLGPIVTAATELRLISGGHLVAKAGEDHPAQTRVAGEREARLGDRDGGRLPDGIAVNPAADRRQGDGRDLVRMSEREAVPIAGREQFRLALVPAAPDRPDRMDDVPRGQSIAFGKLRLARPAAAEQPAFVNQLRPGGAVDGPIDAAAAEQRTVRRIDDRVHLEPGDVAAMDFDPVVRHLALPAVSAPPLRYRQSVNDAPPPLQRKIIHIDMDAFYASVEQRDDPALRGKPVAVGGQVRGVVAAASYEARKYGIRSAMPSVTAKRRCPELIFVKPRFDAYRAVSQQIRAIFADYTPLVEPLSLDEAYLDVTEDLKGIGIATAIAEEIRARIRAETGLTASAGVSYNKFIAKLASDQNKPDGLCVVTPARGEAFVAALPVKRFHGIGPKTAAKMARLGIESGADLRAQSLAFLTHNFGSSGQYYHDLARAICHRQVKPDRPWKSLGAEDTFFGDLSEEAALTAELEKISHTVWRRLSEKGIAGRTVTLKVKYQDFRIVTRARSLGRAVASREEFLEIGCALLRTLLPAEKGIRLLGLTLSNLSLPAEAEPAPLELELPL